MTSPLPHGLPSSPDYWLMKWSLENSNTYDSIKWRLGTALKAQEFISQSVSRPLSSAQWQVEASQLFATSLARIQYDAWDTATGADRGRPGYVEMTPEEGQGRLCGLYKFKTSDYTNVNLAAFLGIILASFTLCFLTWDPHTIGLQYKSDFTGVSGSKYLMIDLIIGLLAAAILTIRARIVSLYSRTLSWIKSRKARHERIEDQAQS